MRNAQREMKILKPVRQVIVNGQSLGARMTNFKEFLQFYLPGYTVVNVCRPGTGYTGLRKGTVPFEQSILAGGEVVVIVHGELESILNTSAATYAGYLQSWRDDYAAALHKPNLKLLFCQVSSQTYNYFGTPTVSNVALGQFNAAFDGTHTGLYMMGPKYQFPYDATDHTHLTTSGCSWLGQKYALTLVRLIANEAWTPLYPTSITRVGAAVTLHLSVPVGPLVFDTATFSAHPNGKYGLVYNDSGGTVSISSTPVISGSTSTFNLSATPSSSPRKIRYGYWPAAGTTPVAYDGYPDAYASGGMIYGNIRDSDSVPRYVGSTAYNMGNWLVHFEMDVP
jgi:hypothetical protein